MALEAGSKLGHYEIVSALGAGGMGEVYRARDTKLGREVALKLLLDEVSGDTERLARFEREALVLASLNHPNIATLHGFEREACTSFLVMELVQGETLADRIDRGPIPVGEAVPLFEQIARGLETAHEQGVIHRDLKPANVKILPDGTVKVLDFGLAKDVSTSTHPDGDAVSQSPTLTLEATRLGQILGTAAYMSPEQAVGRQVDHRADVWAFGACLYEALSGRRAFDGSTSQEVLAKVIERAPDWTALPSTLPPSLRRLLERSLEKDPRRRLRHIGDAGLELSAAALELEGRESDVGGRAIARASARLIALLLAIGLAIGGSAGWLLRRSPSDSSTLERGQMRSSIELPVGTTIASPTQMPYSLSRMTLAISPDGRQIVYVAVIDGVRRLISRELDSFEHTVLDGSEGATNPFYSPDGQWIAFFTRDMLMKIPRQGGRPVTVCEAGTSGAGTWSDDGWIYFIHREVTLARVAGSGGDPINLTDRVTSSVSALPDGKGVLASVRSGWKTIGHDVNDLVHVAPNGDLRVLATSGYSPSYVPTGHLVFMRSGELMAAPFDIEDLSVEGPSVKVLDRVATDSLSAVSQYSFARNGTLIFVEGGDWARTIPSWIDRDGRSEPLPQMPPGVYGQLSLSPDASKVTLGVIHDEDDIYIYDLRRDTFERLTLEGGDTFPVWANDRDVIYGSTRDDGEHAALFRQTVGGTGAPQPLLDPVGAGIDLGVLDHLPTSVSRDGRFLLFVGQHPQRGLDVMLLGLESGSPRLLAATEHSEVNGTFSPNGRWVAYLSDKTGRHEVFVRPFPSWDQEWQISSGGGDDARWSPDGSELFYRDGARLMSVRYSEEPTFQPESPRLLLTTDFHNVAGMSFDIAPGGERFLHLRPVEAAATQRHIRVVSNWFADLERLVPTG